MRANVLPPDLGFASFKSSKVRVLVKQKWCDRENRRNSHRPHQAAHRQAFGAQDEAEQSSAAQAAGAHAAAAQPAGAQSAAAQAAGAQADAEQAAAAQAEAAQAEAEQADAEQADPSQAEAAQAAAAHAAAHAAAAHLARFLACLRALRSARALARSDDEYELFEKLAPHGPFAAAGAPAVATARPPATINIFAKDFELDMRISSQIG